MFIDYYMLLEIKSTASQEEIKRAFKEQALKWHPDRNIGKDTNVKMQQINEAYLILKDAESRERYDIEYRKFQAKFAYKQPENKMDTHYDYSVDDEILKKWMYNAQKQSVNLAKETIEELRKVAKVGIVAAGKEMGNYALAYIAVGILFSLIFGMSRGCS